MGHNPGIAGVEGEWLNIPTSFGIAVFEAEDESAARTIMENDPAVRAGLMRAVLYPYKIALMRR